ncbi:response regulator [Faecalicatena orotica]|uniref:Stage 0 sporulation protein A homolog n=1 Tax=Faecalicatena orotica TaxID=1544 RepID=A0A2Y9BGH4_9FIRM|nr:response regulator [Faecalicatena orotica]PWJ30389.1 response regulator receiver and ANTAR domain protein [Faecalicatena orotica]SSA55380.1 response regulator receiver and ANTAR domain protein [Faecalicatena orotica]
METKKLKVFIAEDEAVILTSFKLMVKEMGYSIAGSAANGKDALEKIQETEPDLILMDINLPERDGLSVLEEVNRNKVIPSIIVSGEFSGELVDRANEVGVFGYLLKPIDEKQLEVTIKVALRRFEEFKEMSDKHENLNMALKERKLVERAKGILMDRFGVKESEAMKQMQKKSRDKNKKLVVIAREIIDAEKLLS